MADDATPSVERLLTESVWLTGLARALLHHDEHAAEDVAQEARLAALRDAPKDPDHARAWLVRVARNLAFRTQLRRTRRERRERSAAVHEALPSTLDLVARVNAQKRVADAVVALDEPYRSVVLLRYFDALTARDIAERQRVPIETVRTRIKRALAQLRERLDRDFGKRDAWAGLLLPWAVPVEGAATATATGAGTAAVATGVATMSLTAKLVTSAVVLAAAALVFQFAWPGTARSPSNHDAATDVGLAPAAKATELRSDVRQEGVLPATATRTEETPTAASPDASGNQTVRAAARIVRATDGTPVDGALLVLSSIRCDDGRWVDVPLGQAKSNGDGWVELSLPAVPPDMNQLEVVAPGFATLLDEFIQAIPVVDRKLDLGTRKLERGARVSGRVIRARNGQPMANAELRLVRGYVAGEFHVDRSRHEGTSGSDGSFVLSEPVVAPKGKPLLLFAVTDEGIGWKSFDVAAGTEAVTVDVPVDGVARMEVALRDAAGAAIPSAVLSCAPCFNPLAPTRRGVWAHHVVDNRDPLIRRLFVRTTDENGMAVFDALPTGIPTRDGNASATNANQYEIVAAAPGYDVAWDDFVTVDPAVTTRRTLVLRRSRTITLVGKVAGFDGEPVPDAQVEAWSNLVPARATTDEHGAYRIDGLPTAEGTTYLKVSAEGRDGFEDLFRFDELRRTPLVDGAGAPVEARVVDFRLERIVHIAGRVVDEAGAPVAGATVRFDRVRDGRLPRGSDRGERTTARDGRFDFEATEATWGVNAWARLGDGTNAPATYRVVKGGASDLVIPCVTREPAGATLECVVVDARSGLPLRPLGAMLRTADGLEFHRWVPKCESGIVTTAGLAIGRWQLDLRLDDRRSCVREFDVATRADAVRLRVEVGAMARVAGRVEIDPTVPAALLPDPAQRKIRVTWTPSELRAVGANGEWLGEASSGGTAPDESGRFFLAEVVPGQVTRLSASVGDDLYAEVVFVPTSGEARDLVLKLRPSARVVTERVDDFSAGNLVVDLAMGDEPWHREFSLGQLPRDARDSPKPIKPGHYRWRALYLEPAGDGAVPRVRSAEGEFDVAAGETFVLRITGLR